MPALSFAKERRKFLLKRKKKDKAVDSNPGNLQQMYETKYCHKSSVNVEIRLDNRTLLFSQTLK